MHEIDLSCHFFVELYGRDQTEMVITQIFGLSLATIKEIAEEDGDSLHAAVMDHKPRVRTGWIPRYRIFDLYWEEPQVNDEGRVELAGYVGYTVEFVGYQLPKEYRKKVEL